MPRRAAIRQTGCPSALLLGVVWLLSIVPCAAQQRDAGTVERQRRAVLAAAEQGDLSTINRVLMAGGTIDVRDDLNRSPLLLAVAADKLEAVRTLLSEGADINAQAHDFDTPWLLAGARGRTDMLRLMVVKGPDFAKRNRYGGNALIPACHYGHVETVKFLLTTSIELDLVNTLGWTCLLEAVLLGDGGPKHQAIVKLMLAAGADPNIADKRGNTALAHARARGQSMIMAILEAGGAR
jgi:uncharacterized protein